MLVRPAGLGISAREPDLDPGGETKLTLLDLNLGILADLVLAAGTVVGADFCAATGERETKAQIWRRLKYQCGTTS